MHLKIFVFCRLLPSVLAWIAEMTLASGHRMAHAAGNLMSPLGALWFRTFFQSALVIAIAAMMNQVHSRSKFL